MHTGSCHPLSFHIIVNSSTINEKGQVSVHQRLLGCSRFRATWLLFLGSRHRGICLLSFCLTQTDIQDRLLTLSF